MDSSIQPSKKYPGFYLVSTTDFFYPLVEDPYKQGKIAAANVLSDMYAMGVVDIDSVLSLLALSREMNPSDRSIVTKLMLKGFEDALKQAGTTLNGGQSVMNPWPIIGGVAQSMCRDNDFILPTKAIVGDVLVLTKPLGIQVAVNAQQWIRTNRYEKYRDILSESDVHLSYALAEQSMMRLNRSAALLMHKYDAHAATDITGFGLIGHADNLMKNQENQVSFLINRLPIIKGMVALDEARGRGFRLLAGYAAETSGGLLIALSKENAIQYIKELQSLDSIYHSAWNRMGWIIGEVIQIKEEGKREVIIAENAEIIEVI